MFENTPPVILHRILRNPPGSSGILRNPPVSPETVSATAGPNLPSARAGGQDDGSYTKLLQIIIYNVVINACARPGYVAGRDIITYHVVINDCAKSRCMEKAARWLFNVQDAQVKADIIFYHVVTNACAKSRTAPKRLYWTISACNAQSAHV